MDSTTALTPSAAASAYIPKTCVTGKGAIITGTAASTPTALGVGTDGQVLIACSAAAGGLCWATSPAPAAATPTVAGIVLGCTNATNAALGCNALLVNAGIGNVAVGLDSLRANTSGNTNIAVGLNSMRANTTGSNNVAVGNGAFCSNTIGTGNVAIGTVALDSAVDGSWNVAIGENALCAVSSGYCNVALGFLAGSNITTGSSNVALGPNAAVTSATGSCQLAIGYSATCNWLIGDSNKHIQPGAGIRDCAGNLGTAGQVLRSTGSAIQWATPSNSVISLNLGGNAIVGAPQQLVPYWDCAYALNPPAGVTLGAAFNGCVSAAVTFPIGCALKVDYSLTVGLCETPSSIAILAATISVVNNGSGVAYNNSLSQVNSFVCNFSTFQLSQSFYVNTLAGVCGFAMQINKSGGFTNTWRTYAGYGNWTFTVLN